MSSDDDDDGGVESHDVNGGQHGGDVDKQFYGNAPKEVEELSKFQNQQPLTATTGDLNQWWF